MIQSLKILYRSQINPMRKILTANLERAFKKNNPNIKLEFKNYEELNVQPATASVPTPTALKMAADKVSFDFDDTLTTEKGISALKDAISSGATIYIISARNTESGMYSLADEYGIPHSRVYATGSNSNKIKKILELGIKTHYDNNSDVIDGLDGVGKKI
jgi:hypothetical protein